MYGYGNGVGIEELVGKTFSKVFVSAGDSIKFVSDDHEYEMTHQQDCCEHVRVEDIIGDLKDLENSPILSAEESTNRNDPPSDNFNESWTWTFYHIRTVKGAVTIRWLGESNGYYSESVDLLKRK